MNGCELFTEVQANINEWICIIFERLPSKGPSFISNSYDSCPILIASERTATKLLRVSFNSLIVRYECFVFQVWFYVRFLKGRAMKSLTSAKVLKWTSHPPLSSWMRFANLRSWVPATSTQRSKLPLIVRSEASPSRMVATCEASMPWLFLLRGCKNQESALTVAWLPQRVFFLTKLKFMLSKISTKTAFLTRIFKAFCFM